MTTAILFTIIGVAILEVPGETGLSRWNLRVIACSLFAAAILTAYFHDEASARPPAWATAHASWYGPGLYGNRTACGQTLRPGTVGVAHKSLPCGTLLAFKYRGRIRRARVIDRGPYIAGRDFDLTEALANRLRFTGHGPIQWRHERKR